MYGAAGPPAPCSPPCARPPQFYNGFSGQALVDSITAAVFNVVFTSLPILLFSILDRPVKNLRALIRYPRVGPEWRWAGGTWGSGSSNSSRDPSLHVSLPDH